MKTVAKRFFDMGHGNPIVVSHEINKATYDDAASIVYTPSSGKCLSVMWMAISWVETGSNSNVYVAFFDSGASGVDPTNTIDMIWDRDGCTGYIIPTFANFSAAPILGNTDQLIRTKKHSETNSAYLVMGLYEVDTPRPPVA
jgi:hypothetical protein